MLVIMSYTIESVLIILRSNLGASQNKFTSNLNMPVINSYKSGLVN